MRRISFAKVEKIILLFTVGLSGCCEFCNDNAPTYAMDQDFKDYTLFPVGSYWIYSEEISKAYDSVYLYQQEVAMNDSYKIRSYKYEYFSQSLGTTFFNDTLFGGSSAERYHDTVYFAYAERFLSNFIVTNRQFFNRLAIGTTLHVSDDSQVKYAGELNSFLAADTEYRDVRIFECLIQADDRLPGKIYYAKGIGVVRKELFNGQTWNLKRYFINR